MRNRLRVPVVRFGVARMVSSSTRAVSLCPWPMIKRRRCQAASRKPGEIGSSLRDCSIAAAASASLGLRKVRAAISQGRVGVCCQCCSAFSFAAPIGLHRCSRPASPAIQSPRSVGGAFLASASCRKSCRLAARSSGRFGASSVLFERSDLFIGLQESERGRKLRHISSH